MNEPKEYLPRMPVRAMQVAQPYGAVAKWCHGTLIRNGNMGRVKGLSFFNAEGLHVVANVGDYIGEDPISTGWFVLYPQEEFEQFFEEKR